MAVNSPSLSRRRKLKKIQNGENSWPWEDSWPWEALAAKYWLDVGLEDSEACGGCVEGCRWHRVTPGIMPHGDRLQPSPSVQARATNVTQ